jgi:ABC-type amino acid transport substrate-binding protein
VFSVPVSGADLSRLTPAGTYLTDAPAAFVATEGTASVEPSLTLDSLPPGKVAVQNGSPAFWLLTSEFGEKGVESFDSLREALEALSSGDVAVAAGDALVGAYIARDLPQVRFAGQLAPATPLAVAVGPENAELSDAVRVALDELAADGVLDSVRNKWVGDLPELTVPDTGDDAPVEDAAP